SELVEQEIITEDEKKQIIQGVLDEMREAHDKIDKSDTNVDGELKTPKAVLNGHENADDDIGYDRLKDINETLFNYPKDVTVFHKDFNVLHRRNKPFEDQKPLLDWAHAQALDFAPINPDGTPIRLTGQDSERGTFAQRDVVLHEPETGKEFIPLHE